MTTLSLVVGIAQFVQLVASFHAPSASGSQALIVEGVAEPFLLSQVRFALDSAEYPAKFCVAKLPLVLPNDMTLKTSLAPGV